MPVARRSWLGDVGLTAGGAAAGQLALVAATPVLSRIYAPTDLGQFAVIVAWSNFLALVVTFRAELLIPRVDRQDARAVERFGLIGAIVLSPVAVAVIILSTDLSDSSTPLAVYFGLFVGAAATNAAINVKAIALLAESRPRDLGILRAAVGLGQAVLQVGLGVFWASSALLIAAYVTANALGFLAASRRSATSTAMPRPGRWRGVQVVRKHYRTLALTVPTTLLSNAYIMISTVGMELVFGPAAAGIYFVGRRLVITPLQLIANTMGEHFFVEASSDPDRNKIEQAMKSRFKVLAPLSICLSALAALAALLLPYVLGEVWEQTRHVVWSLIPVGIGQLLVSPFGNVLLALDQEHRRLIWNLVRLVANIAALAVFAIYDIDLTPALYVLGGLNGLFFLVLWRQVVLVVRTS